MCPSDTVIAQKHQREKRSRVQPYTHLAESLGHNMPLKRRETCSVTGAATGFTASVDGRKASLSNPESAP